MKKRTIRYRKHDIDNLAGSPPLGETEMELIQRKVKIQRPFRNCGLLQTFPSKVNKKGHTRLCRKTDREVYPEGKLYQGNKREVESDPPIFTCDGVYPRHVMNDPRKTNSKP